ncbi:phenylacetic acid degradation protein PaaD [Catellatospora methionotrophica]|uniref:Phenylacetic acid degradation protein PaaD n=1 Tax=Catellatospora methionotrophica TaxID=121620 RepID=A0A8J3LBC0_9ACTN|nr:hydroxyphenylacetyl-CoA thioesterase PaaI [Catellatospora methionotrophica]GIG15043.1 phenylacetic acid degradation protein PaaD [Catellatospora methionotrophica]
MTAVEDPACQALGIRLEHVDAGRARLRMLATPAMANLHGTVHGGYLFLLADAAFAYASNSHGRPAVAHSAQITFVRAAEVGDHLVAEAAEVTRHGRSGVYDVTITRHTTEVIAVFRGNSMTVATIR